MTKHPRSPVHHSQWQAVVAAGATSHSESESGLDHDSETASAVYLNPGHLKRTNQPTQTPCGDGRTLPGCSRTHCVAPAPASGTARCSRASAVARSAAPLGLLASAAWAADPSFPISTKARRAYTWMYQLRLLKPLHGT
jgi:hypothetical protein